jgi:hypothetical protein
VCDINAGNFRSMLYLLRNEVYFLMNCLLGFAALCGGVRCNLVCCKFFPSNLLSSVLDLVNYSVCLFQHGRCPLLELLSVFCVSVTQFVTSLFDRTVVFQIPALRVFILSSLALSFD